MHRLCVDIDNVIARTDEVMRNVITQFTNGRVNYKYSHIVEFDYHKCFDASGSACTKEEWRHIHDRFSDPEIILSVPPMEGARENLIMLSSTFDIHLATTRLPKARGATLEWLTREGFPPFDIHFLKHGEKHVSMSNFFAAIEDHYDQAVAFATHGIRCFLLRHPWNQTKPAREGIEWVDNWNELTRRLLALV